MQLDWNKLCPRCMQEGVVNDYCTLCNHPVPTDQEPRNGLPIKSLLHGQYMVGKALGHGGFGVTYVALDLRDGHKVAIKEYFPDSLASRSLGQRTVYPREEYEFNYGLKHFVDEARTLHALMDTPNIIRVEKLFSENNTAYFAMEFLQGSDLHHYLSNMGGALSYGDTVSLLYPVMTSLHKVHGLGVIHRDIAPDNIFILDTGEVKLIDFGAAHVALSQKSQSYNHVQKVGYSPLEQVSASDHQGPWTDVYAMAATVYRCLTGSKPAKVEDRMTNPAAFVSPKAMGAPVTRKQDEVIMKGLALYPEERYQSVQEFADDLMRLANDKDEETIRQGGTNIVTPQPDYERIRKLDPPLPMPPEPVKRSIWDYILPWRWFRREKTEIVTLNQPQQFRASDPTVRQNDFVPPPPPPPPQPMTPMPSPYCMAGIQGALTGQALMLYCDHPLRIGRNKDYCDVVYPDGTKGVSGQHLSVWYDSSRQCIMVEDLGSSFGTYVIVNDVPRKLTPHVLESLGEGDTIVIGMERFMIRRGQ